MVRHVLVDLVDNYLRPELLPVGACHRGLITIKQAYNLVMNARLLAIRMREDADHFASTRILKSPKPLGLPPKIFSDIKTREGDAGKNLGPHV